MFSATTVFAAVLNVAIASSAVSPATFVKGDFDGDGDVDFIEENDTSDIVFVGIMNGLSFSGAHDVIRLDRFTFIKVPDEWDIVGTPDWDRDGRTDLLWRNRLTGENAAWFLDGMTYRSGASLLAVTDLNWAVGGMADFNGDGSEDIVWRNRTTGQNAIWYMQGTNYVSGELILPVDDPDWMIRSAADFDNDGDGDLVWRNSATGENAIWFMNGSTYERGASIATVTDLTWTILGSADVDRDTLMDILWFRDTAFDFGPIHGWFMNGETYLYGMFLHDGHSAGNRMPSGPR